VGHATHAPKASGGTPCPPRGSRASGGRQRASTRAAGHAPVVRRLCRQDRASRARGCLPLWQRSGHGSAPRRRYGAHRLTGQQHPAPLAAHHRRRICGDHRLLVDHSRDRARSSARASPSRSACSAQVSFPARAALAHILCAPRGRGGSGITAQQLLPLLHGRLTKFSSASSSEFIDHIYGARSDPDPAARTSTAALAAPAVGAVVPIESLAAPRRGVLSDS